jgi:alkylation response protein AidB-like acyl-CoA dehydrogenase
VIDFALGPEAEAFAARVRDWLDAHPPERFPVDGMDAGYGSGAHSRPFLQALADEGWITMTWPRAFGGEERPFVLKLVLLEELARAGAPFGPLSGCDQAADAIMARGSDRLKREVLPKIARGEATFWQGFSEPGAGSDLLGLTTEARRDGAEYVIRGHKIWSSHAGISSYGLVIARTARDTRRSYGLSMFVVDSRTPGMEIRPITSLTGEVYHYEVFLDDVRVPADYLLGAEHQGFRELLQSLDTDRFWGRFYKAPALKRTLTALVGYANATARDGVPLARDAGVRRRFAELAMEVEALRLYFYRLGWMLAEKVATPYETALAKVMADELGQRVGAFGMELVGLGGALAPRSPVAPLAGSIQHFYLTTMGHTIAGGTSEVLRTTVATRGLGLPRAAS